MITDIESFYIKSDQCYISENNTHFTLSLNASIDLISKFTHCAITDMSFVDEAFSETNQDVIYMHADCVDGRIGTELKNGNKAVDIIKKIKRVDGNNYPVEPSDLISNMKKFTPSNQITFHFTDSEYVDIILDNHCDFTFHLIQFTDGRKFDRVLDKLEILFDVIAKQNS